MKTWIISAMDTAPQEGSLQDVVKTIHWRRNDSVVDSQGKTWFAETYGAVACPSPSPTDFTAYPDLTQAQVEGWLEELLDVPAIDASLDANIAMQQNPPIVSLPLPWDSNPGA